MVTWSTREKRDKQNSKPTTTNESLVLLNRGHRVNQINENSSLCNSAVKGLELRFHFLEPPDTDEHSLNLHRLLTASAVPATFGCLPRLSLSLRCWNRSHAAFLDSSSLARASCRVYEVLCTRTLSSSYAETIGSLVMLAANERK